MITEADALIAFWDGKSKYTKDLIEKAKGKKIKFGIINFNNPIITPK